MTLRRDEERSLDRQGKLAAVVVAVTAVLWLALQWIAPQLGLAGNYAYLIDFFALAAFAWAIIVGVRIWRRRRGN